MPETAQGTPAVGRTTDPPAVDYRFKVCLLGEEAVGKSSLVARFVLNQFSQRYARSLGALTVKKELAVPLRGRTWNVVMVIWDVMGERSLRDLMKDAYFGGTHGILCVADLTRRETILAVPEWIDAAQSVAGKTPVVLLGNKHDLHPTNESITSFAALAARLNAPHWLTSAKTGENVENAFQSAATAILQKSSGESDSDPAGSVAARGP